LPAVDHGFYDADLSEQLLRHQRRGGSGHAIRLVYLQGPDRLLWKTNPGEQQLVLAGQRADCTTVLVPDLQERWSGWQSRLRQHRRGHEVGGVLADGAVGSDAVWADRRECDHGSVVDLHAGGSSLIMGYQPVGPYWNQLNNNEWHRATYLLQPASAPGAADGIARMWVDGTKIVDISAAAAE